MVAEQDSSYADWFVIGILTEVPGVDGGIAKSYVDGAPKLGSIFNPTSSQAYSLGQLDVEKYTAFLRCNSTLSFTVGDRISVFSRNDSFENEIFYVSAPPVYFRTCMVVPLTLVNP
jgi:hypothetical protein